MTARARITQADLVQAATLAKTAGVTVTITAPNGKVYTVAPAGVAIPGDSRREGNSCDEAFGGRS